MRKLLLAATCLVTMAAFTNGPVKANEELIKMSQNPKEWVMPAGDYWNQRFSKLNQITAENVGKLQVAWTFSTGVLRGHEGGTPGDRRDDVCSYAIPEHGLCA